MQKKGLSDIITTVLIILLVLAAIVIIWSFVKPLISRNITTANYQAKCLELNIMATCTPTSFTIRSISVPTGVTIKKVNYVAGSTVGSGVLTNNQLTGSGSNLANLRYSVVIGDTDGSSEYTCSENTIQCTSS